MDHIVCHGNKDNSKILKKEEECLPSNSSFSIPNKQYKELWWFAPFGNHIPKIPPTNISIARETAKEIHDIKRSSKFFIPKMEFKYQVYSILARYNVNFVEISFLY